MTKVKNDRLVNLLTLTDEEHKAISSFATWWAMIEAQQELAEDAMEDGDIALHFMGSGASTQVSVGDLRTVISILTAVQVKAAALDVENNSPKWFAHPIADMLDRHEEWKRNYPDQYILVDKFEEKVVCTSLDETDILVWLFEIPLVDRGRYLQVHTSIDW